MHSAFSPPDAPDLTAVVPLYVHHITNIFWCYNMLRDQRCSFLFEYHLLFTATCSRFPAHCHANCMALFVFSIAQVHSHAYSQSVYTGRPPQPHLSPLHTYTPVEEPPPPSSYVTRIRSHYCGASIAKTTGAIFNTGPQNNINRRSR